MSKCNRDQVEWVSLEFVSISTANAAAFYFNKDVVIANCRNRVLLISKCSFSVSTATCAVFGIAPAGAAAGAAGAC